MSRCARALIWGGLVPYDQVWVAGSHHATRITFEAYVQIDKQKIPAGSYTFFVIPSRKGLEQEKIKVSLPVKSL
ncbi:MAG: DUF2911 domain-containing protein [Cyclobacteriaceae bacterium]|nr:DUF2911 domain-containing protein [Cyclobacteriaceae bacterium]